MINIENIGLNKKILIVCIALILIVTGLFIFLIPKEYKPTKIEAVPFAYKFPDGTVSINVSEATNGKGYTDRGDNIHYRDEKYWTVFTGYGLYNNELFTNVYKEDDKILMQITPNLDPWNGIIEGYMTFKINKTKEELLVNIFLDRDWKNNVKGTTNIIWGKEFQNIKEFGFNEISPGIYMDTIVDKDAYRFEVGYEGPDTNVAVTNATLEDVKADRTEGIIVIMFR